MLRMSPMRSRKPMHDRLSKLSGDQFDNQFAQAMVADHKKDIRAYEKEAKSKGPLADFAQQTLPTLQKHLETAEAVSRQKQSRR